MSIENISEGLGSHQIQKGLVNSKQKTKFRNNEENSSKSHVDRVEISEDAKKLMKQDPVAQPAEQVDRKIEKVKLRPHGKSPLASIPMDSSEQEKAVMTIIETFMNENSGLSLLDDSREVDLEVRWTKIHEVGRRIKAEYYKRKDIVNAIIDKLLIF